MCVYIYIYIYNNQLNLKLDELCSLWLMIIKTNFRSNPSGKSVLKWIKLIYNGKYSLIFLSLMIYISILVHHEF